MATILSRTKMSGGESFSTTELLKAHAQVWNHIYNFISSSAVKCAVELDIPDVLFKHGKPMCLSDLLAQLPLLHPSKLASLPILLRFLVHADFLNQHENYCYFSLTPASRLLVKNEPLNVRPKLFLSHNPIIQKSWFELSRWFQDDSPNAFHTAHGKSFWDYVDDSEEQKSKQLGDLFNDAMASDSRLTTDVIIAECEHAFSGLTSLVDVGGGTGTTATAIAKAFPTMMCVVLDLPNVIGDRKEINSENNLEFVGGSMFDEIPHANAILLKWILHNWSNEDCVKILKKCKESIPSRDKGGKLIIIDIVLEENPNKLIIDEFGRAQHFMDMVMMVLYGNKERTKKEWEKLFDEAGFNEYKITPLGLMSLIEVYP